MSDKGDDTEQPKSPREETKSENKPGKMDSIKHPIKALKRFFRRIVKGKGNVELQVEKDGKEVKLKSQKEDFKAPSDLLKEVKVEGEGMNGGIINEPLQFYVKFPENAEKPHLKADVKGPSEPDLEMAYVDNCEFSVIVKVSKPGNYRLAMFWGSYNSPLPGSPFKFHVKAKETEKNEFLDENAHADGDLGGWSDIVKDGERPEGAGEGERPDAPGGERPDAAKEGETQML